MPAVLQVALPWRKEATKEGFKRTTMHLPIKSSVHSLYKTYTHWTHACTPGETHRSCLNTHPIVAALSRRMALLLETHQGLISGVTAASLNTVTPLETMTTRKTWFENRNKGRLFLVPTSCTYRVEYKRDPGFYLGFWGKLQVRKQDTRGNGMPSCVCRGQFLMMWFVFFRNYMSYLFLCTSKSVLFSVALF